MSLESGEEAIRELPRCLVELFAHHHTALLYLVTHFNVIEKTTCHNCECIIWPALGGREDEKEQDEGKEKRRSRKKERVRGEKKGRERKAEKEQEKCVEEGRMRRGKKRKKRRNREEGVGW